MILFNSCNFDMVLAPDYRYGTGYIVSLIALIFSLITYKNLNKNFSKFSIIL